jgi:outer membrane usher protein FimD/PapC
MDIEDYSSLASLCYTTATSDHLNDVHVHADNYTVQTMVNNFLIKQSKIIVVSNKTYAPTKICQTEDLQIFRLKLQQ